MSTTGDDQRLSRIQTLRSRVHEAIHGSGEAARQARQELFDRYGGAAHRYLLGALRDEEAADDLFQDFWVKFLRGFHHYDPAGGRFRDYLRTALSNLVTDHRVREQKRRQRFTTELPDVADPSGAEGERLFEQSWAAQLKELALGALKEVNLTWYTVLRLRDEQPSLSSAELAERAGEALGTTMNVENARQFLSRGRDRYADLLLREVIRSLGSPSREELLGELRRLGWLAPLQAALQRQGLATGD